MNMDYKYQIIILLQTNLLLSNFHTTQVVIPLILPDNIKSFSVMCLKILKLHKNISRLWSANVNYIFG